MERYICDIGRSTQVSSVLIAREYRASLEIVPSVAIVDLIGREKPDRREIASHAFLTKNRAATVARPRWGSVVCKRRVLIWKTKPMVSIFQDTSVASDLKRHVA
jgi:tRNA G37 N-methylase Trm5